MRKKYTLSFLNLVVRRMSRTFSLKQEVAPSAMTHVSNGAPHNNLSLNAE